MAEDRAETQAVAEDALDSSELTARMRTLLTAIRIGVGTPEAAVAAPVGAIFLRTNGGAATTLYVKESGGIGNTGWVAK